MIRAGSSGAELDADATRAYLLEQASGNSSEIARISALSNEELRKEDTGSHVFLQLYGKVLDAWKISTSFCRRSKEGTQCLIS